MDTFGPFETFLEGPHLGYPSCDTPWGTSLGDRRNRTPTVEGPWGTHSGTPPAEQCPADPRLQNPRLRDLCGTTHEGPPMGRPLGHPHCGTIPRGPSLWDPFWGKPLRDPTSGPPPKGQSDGPLWGNPTWVPRGGPYLGNPMWDPQSVTLNGAPRLGISPWFPLRNPPGGPLWRNPLEGPPLEDTSWWTLLVRPHLGPL